MGRLRGRTSAGFRSGGALAPPQSARCLLGVALLLTLLGGVAPPPAAAQAPERKIAEMELLLLGVSATVEPVNPVIPKNTDAGVRIVVRAGGRALSLAEAAAFFGAGFWVEGELAGFSLEKTLTLSSRFTGADLSADPLLLPIPGLTASGDYELNNLRVMAEGRPVLEVQPQHVPVKVIEQVLVTSVTTRPLTLDEIRAKGIVLDSDDYYAFEFTLGLKLESKAVSITFPVAFDRQGVPIPQFILPPPSPTRQADLPPLPTIVPVLFEVDEGPAGAGPGPRLPPLPSGGGEVRIPSVIIVPGNVGYLKQFFSAKLFVANGAPVGSGLTVRGITGTIALPPGDDQARGTADDPLALPELLRDGQKITQPATLPVDGLGPDGEPGTGDDVASLAPGQQGEAEFLVRGEREGFHTIDFDIRAILEGLVTGPVRIKGKASGPVLVRNPYFDVTFTVPGVIRTGETFKIFVTLTNLSDVAANSVSVTLPEGVASGATFVGSLPPAFPTIAAREAKVFELLFRAQKTGQVVASYLRFDPEDGVRRPVGHLQLAVGIGERGVPLSPDTLVLPAAVDALPASVVEAAMRVLGQGWSIANAPTGTLPRDVVRTNRSVVTQKALALAEAGLRVSLGQEQIDALRDVAFDFWGGQPLDPGFDQLLRATEAGRELRRAIGLALADDPKFPTPLELESALAAVAASGPDFASFAVTGGDPAAPLGIALFDASGRQTSTPRAGTEPSEIPGAAVFRLGTETNAPVLGIVATAAGAPFRLDLHSAVDTVADVSITLPKGDGTFVRGDFRGVVLLAGTVARLAHDPLRPGEIVLAKEGESVTRDGAAVASPGPRLVSATVIGPETLQGASPFGFQLVALFDRVVDADSSSRSENYAIPKNGAQGAKRQLSGRLVFVSLEQPEGPHIPTTFSVLGGVRDPRGTEGPSGTVDVGSRLEDKGAVVSGRVFQADGTPVTSGAVTYVNNSDLTCYRPNETGFAAQALDSEGHYEFRYVRQDNCGQPFKMVTVDPATGGRRQASAFVRAAGEAITLDLALFGRGAVEGTVRDAGRNPVPGASVAAFSQTDPQIGGAARTDGLGHYFIDDLTVGPIVVRAGKGVALGSQPGRIERAGTTATVDITLDGQAARVSGTVYKLENDEQEPVPGVSVLFKHLSAGDPYGQILGATTTAADGTYAFDGVPVGQFEVSAALNQRDRDAKQGVAVAGAPVSKDLLIVIPKPAEMATVSGQVFMPDGQTPASDVVVSIRGRGVVSSDGRFTIEGVAVQSDAQTVTAQSRDGRRSGATTVVPNQPRVYDGLRIVLSGLGNAAFRVLDEKGQAVKGQQVALLGQCGNPCGCAVATTDDDGVALFKNLSYGHVYAKAIRSTAAFIDVANGSLAIAADDSTVLTTMRFAGAGRVEGTVRDALDAPVHGADVTLFAVRFEYDGANVCDLRYGYASRTRSSLAGTYSLTGINLGQVSVSATQDFFGSAAVGNRGVLTEPGQSLTLDMKFADTTAGVLSGNVFLPGGALAGAGIEVTVEGPLPEVKVTTDASGHYEFPHILPEGYYKLTARDPVGGGLARVNVTLKRQEPLSRDVQLEGRGTVRVQVVNGVDDEPVESALVKLTETEFPSRSFDQSVRPGNQGTALFLDVYEGPLRIDVSDPFARSGSATAVLPGPGQEISVQVKVTPTGRVTGRFLMPNRAPVPYGTVTLKASGKVLGQTTALGSGDVGRFSFDYVPVGPVTLDAQDPLTGRVGFKSGALDHEGDPPLELDVIAQGLGRVFGTVARGGSPQPLARVAISSGDYQSTTLTDGSGGYDVDGVPEGRVTVTASLNDGGFLAGSSSAALEGDAQSVRIDVALRAAGSVTGRIVPATEEDRAAGRFPASEVRLSVGGTGGGSQETSTRPDGTFSFDVVPTGRVDFAADVVDSIDRGSVTLDVVAGANTVEIPLVGVGRLEGQGVASEDAGAPGVDGWIFFSGSAFPDGARVRLGNDGLFEIPEVLAGDFTARLQHGQGALALYGSATGTVAPGQEKEIRVALQPSGEIRGSVFRPAATPEGQRPAFGAEVRIVLAKGGEIPLLAQEDGRFSVKGVPQGEFSVRVLDPISGGRAVRSDRSLGGSDRCGLEPGTCHDVGAILIDDQPPALGFVQPAPGSTRSAFGGLLVIDAPDDVDPSSLVVRYASGHSQGASLFTFENGRFSGTLYAPAVQLGANRLTVSAKDTAGNEGGGEVTFMVTGGTARGQVIGADGQTAAAGVPVKLGSLDLLTDAEGRYRQDGLRAGTYTARATDPATGLQSPPVTGSLADGGELVLEDLRLPAAGSIAGTVVRADATTVAGAGVTVDVGGRTYTTGAEGAFVTAALLPSTYPVEARSPNGDRGRKSVVVGAGAPTPATIVLNGLGSAKVTVLKADGPAAVGATVKIDSSAGFPDPDPVTTNASGEAFFPAVLAGAVSATAEYRGLEETAPAQVLQDGGHRDFTITLPRAARLAGHVRNASGAPVVGATVLLAVPRTESTTSGAEGAYELTEVPLGPFTVEASTPDGDKGRETGVLGANPPPVDITLAGFGDLVVVVRDAQGEPIPQADVSVASVKLGGLGSRSTDAQGLASFLHVRAGALDLSVQAEGLTADRRVTLPAGGSLTETFVMGAKGSVSGTVRAPGSADGIEGVQVTVGEVTTVTGLGGTYTVGDLAPRTYTVDAKVNGHLRARKSIEVRSGEAADGSLELVGVGTIQGTVRNGGVPVDAASVETLVGGTFGGTFAAQSGPNGGYVLAGIPVQAALLAVTAKKGDLSADGRVGVEYHGQEIPLDFDLVANAVAVPRVVRDGNQVPWEVQPDGSLRQSYVFGFSTVPTTGGSRLSLVRGTEERAFVGRGQAGLEATEDAQRETVLREDGLFGLRVTRKVLVPQDGYFVRFLEVLENDGDTPVTVDLVLKSVLSDGYNRSWGTGPPQLLPRTSPRFVVVDDARTQDFYLSPSQTDNQLPPLAIAFGGSEAQAPAVELSGYELRYRWSGVAVPARGRAVVMHVWTSQSDRTRAEASGDRLAGLPPELLAGLSATEAEAIRNFNVPADLQSTLAPLPPNDGVVTVRVLAGDAQTPVNAAPIFRSRSLYYSRPLSTTGPGPDSFDRRYRLVATATDLVPRLAFDLTTRVFDFGSVYATASGGFPSSGVVELSATEGRTLQASSSASTSYAPTKAFDFNLDTSWRASADDSLDHGRTPWLEVTFPAPVTVHRVAVRGSPSGGFASRARLELFDASGQPAGSVESFDLPGPAHDADVVLPSPVAGVARVRFVALAGSGSPALAELSVFGEGGLGAVRRADVDLVFQGTGIVDVRVARADGTPLHGYAVRLSRGGVSESRTTNDGNVRFLVVPEGPGWTVTATHPNGGASVTRSSVTVASGPAAPPLELRFPAFASVSGTLLSHARQPVAGRVDLTSTVGYSRTLYTNSQFTSFEFSDVPPGTYTLRATDYWRSNAVVTTASFSATGGANQAPEIVFPAVGTIRITTTSGNQAYAGARVRWRSPSSGIGWQGSYPTDGAGKLTLWNVAGPTADLEVSRPDLPLAPVTRTVSISEELAQLDETFDLPGTTTLSGTLRALDGVPYSGHVVEAWNEAGTSRIAQATTSSTGAFSVTVPPGIVWLRAAGDCGSTWGEVRVDLATTASADALLPRGTIARPGQHDFWEINLESARFTALYASGVANGNASPVSNAALQAYRSDATAVSSSYPDWVYADLVAGRYLLAAGASSGSTGGYDVCGYWPSIGLRPWGGPWVRSQALSGGTALSNHRVRLLRPALPTLETVTDDSGAFALPLIMPGPFAIEIVDSADVVVGRATGLAEPGADVLLPTVVVPARATVTVIVERSGVGIAGLAVTLTSDNPDALAEDAQRAVTTGDDGRASALVPAGTVTAALDPIETACDKGSQGASACTDTKPTPADFTFTLPDLPTTVIVRVTAADGLTPLPSAVAEIEGGSGPAAVDVDGVVVFPGIPAGRRVVHASAAGREVYQAVDLAGGEATVAVALPAPAIRATLTDSHGAVVASGTVEACGTEEHRYCDGYWPYTCHTYYLRTCVTAPASSSGVHVFDQLARWVSSYPVDLTGRAASSNASTALTGVLVDATSSTVYPVALQLPPTGQVRGTVVASDGVNPVPNAKVWISTDGGEAVALTADAEGTFTAPYVLPGRVTVHAEEPQDAIPGQTRIDLAADGDETVQVRLVPSAVLTLHFDQQDWGGGVDVESPEAPRRLGATTWRRTLTPSPNVSMAVTVPAGWYRVLAPRLGSYPGCSTPAAGAEGLVTDAADVSLSLGTHVVLLRGPAAADGAYGDTGSCQDGGPFVETTVVGVEDYPHVGEPRPEGATGSDIRAVRTLTAVGDGLRVRRERFVPISGAFGRTTTFVTNPAAESRTLTLGSRLMLPNGSWTIATTSDGDATLNASDTWLVLDDRGGQRFGLLLGSGTGRTGGLRAVEHCGEICWTEHWFELSETLNVRGADTAAFTTFSLARSSAPVDVAQEMEALLEQDAVAFEGLSPEERVQVVNLPPPGPPTGVSGTVRMPSGEVVPWAVVGVLRGGLLVAQRPANASGEFTVKGLVPGPVTVVARDPGANRPGRLDAIVTAGVVEALGDLFLLPDAALGRVDALVAYEGGGGAVNETVEVEVGGFGAFWQAAIVTGGDGRGTADGVPAGLVTIRWAGTGDGRAVTGELPPGGVLSLQLVVPVTAVSVNAPVALGVASGPPFLVEANGAVWSSDHACTPFCGSFSFVDDEGYSGGSPLSLVRNREVVTPAEDRSGLLVTRRTFIPFNGKYARLIDVLSNPGTEDRVVRYQLSSSFEAPAGDWTVATTSNGDAEFTPEDAFAVIRAADTGQTAAIVRGGSSSAGLPDQPLWDVSSPGSAEDSSVWTQLRVPAGATVRLMQFLLTRPDGPTAIADARDLAQSLADLTEPTALMGLSAAEQATLLNFRGPGNP